MSRTLDIAAIDLGAESGRVMLARFDGTTIALEEAHRFPNVPVMAGGTLYWDILRLFNDIKHGIGLAAKAAGGALASIGIDAWGVDFALLDAHDRLIGNPVHYRDGRTNGIGEHVFARMPWRQIYERTGIQFLQFNTLFQLAAMKNIESPALDQAHSLLMIPDLLNFWLTGVKVNEYTNATTTQCVDARSRSFAPDMLDALGIRSDLFQPIAQPCTILGALRADIADALGIDAPPIALPATHDTGSAVAGAPLADARSLYISSGTWSLMGYEAQEPVINDAALAHNATNEGGVGGSVRVLKNIMGMWLLQECRRTWAEQGRAYSYSELERLARGATVTARIDVDDSRFLPPGDMPARIRVYCRETGQPEPGTDAEIARCVLDSLASAYAKTAEQFDVLAGHWHDTVHVIGGGSQNALLNELTAAAAGRRVVAGPVEATALGNVIAQLVALGALGSCTEGRALIRAGFANRSGT
jgi:rhamnulokinase